ncbi:MAG: glycosyltransferase [Candidatus Bathyarchaeota archaeon]|nr:glycosyltransferase [Candidatus Bathyarchaeota archaeon]
MRSDTVDVLIVTFNSARTLEKCLEAIRRSVPYERILIGDGGSIDDTIAIARRNGVEVYSFTGDDNKIGRIRYKLAEKAGTDWILYIDSDVYVYQNYWFVMRRTMRSNIGMALALQECWKRI